MKHITYSDKSVLVGDEAADALLEYAALLGRKTSADTVQLAIIGPDGNEGVATFLLNSGAVIMAESTNSALPEPDNSEALAYMKERIASGNPPPSAHPANDYQLATDFDSFAIDDRRN